MHRFQHFHTSRFHCALALKVNQNGALLGLFRRMPADFDEAVDNVIEGVHIIIIDYEFVHFIRIFQHQHLFLVLTFRILI